MMEKNRRRPDGTQERNGRLGGTAVDRDEDIKEMIQREIRSIHALDERVVFKDMM